MPMYGRINKTFEHQNNEGKEMNEIDILRMNVNELQGQLQNAYKRIDQLQELIEVERQTNEEASTSDPIILTE